MRSALLLLCLLNTACAGRAIEPPVIEAFSKMAPPAIQMPGPAPLPARPIAQHMHDSTGDLFAFTPEAAKRLVARDQICEANTEIASACAAGFASLQASCATQLAQAQLLEQQHNYLAERWATAEAELQAREKELEVEAWITRIVLIAVAIVGLADE